jgi:hypothetical protein
MELKFTQPTRRQKNCGGGGVGGNIGLGFLAVNPPGREDELSPPSNAEVQNLGVTFSTCILSAYFQIAH